MIVAGLEWSVLVPLRPRSQKLYRAPPIDTENTFVDKDGWPTERGWGRDYRLRHSFRGGIATIVRTSGGYSLVITGGPFDHSPHSSQSLPELLRDAPALIARHFLVNMR